MKYCFSIILALALVLKNASLYPALLGTGCDYGADPNKPIRPMSAASFITQTTQKKITLITEVNLKK